MRSREVLREDGERGEKKKRWEDRFSACARLRNLFILLSRARVRVTSDGAKWRRMYEYVGNETKTNC